MIDRQVPFLSRMRDWEEEPPTHFQDRLARGFDTSEFETSYSHLSNASYSYPLSIPSGSSMAPMQPPAVLHQSRFSTASNRPPSLLSCTTLTGSSVSTSIVDQCAGYPLLAEGADGVLLQPDLEVNHPHYECAFWFLNCDFLSRDESEWNTHCLSHFRGREPPCSVQCPLCDWHRTYDDGTIAWRNRMQHLSNDHLIYGQTLKTARPDFHLFQYLWQQRLIGDADLKELKGGNHNLDHPPATFVATNHSVPRRERGYGRQEPRERGNDQRGVQHVSARRP